MWVIRSRSSTQLTFTLTRSGLSHDNNDLIHISAFNRVINVGDPGDTGIHNEAHLYVSEHFIYILQ